MLDLAEQSGTPCWSSSALRFAEEYQAADKTNIKGVNALIFCDSPVAGHFLRDFIAGL